VKELELKKKEFIEAKPITNQGYKTFPLKMDLEFHAELSRAARREGETLHNYVLQAVQERMRR
jgi:predicted HicB family RNase H-like nuclease